MSAINKKIIYIDVTKGDCIIDNKIEGKSNTGTYFISSSKDFYLYESYFKETNKYIFDSKKILEYKILFNELFKSKSNLYPGKMTKFDTCCDYLISQPNILVDVTLRINDSRVFMRFKDNNDSYVNAFRNLLYDEISQIAIEQKEDIYHIYPIINDSSIYIEKSDDLVIEE